MKKDSHTKDWLLAGALALLGLGLGQVQNAGLRSGNVDPITSAYRWMSGPFVGTLARASTETTDFVVGIGQSQYLSQEIRRLRAVTLSQSLYEEQINRLDRENQNLRRLLSMREEWGRIKVPAYVIGFAPRELRLTLDVGEAAGVRAGMPVVAAAGLVGTVQAVDQRTAQVLLVTSRSLRVGALVMGRNPAPAGLLRGETGETLVLSFSDPRAPVEVGDAVATSGFSELIPRGIAIGRVIQVQDDEAFGERRAIVAPFVSVGEVREVYVLK